MAQRAERRQQPRVRIEQPVQLHLEETTSYGAATAVDISTGGICVNRAPRATVGERVYCRLIFVESEHLALPCRVVWTRGVDRGLMAMGLAFVGLGIETRRALRRLIKQLSRDHRSTARVPLPGPVGGRRLTARQGAASQWRAMAAGVSLGLLAVIAVVLWLWWRG